MYQKSTFLLIAFLLAFLTKPTDAQTNFVKRIEVERWSLGSSIAQLADGGYVIAGFYSHDSLGLDEHLYLLKTDELGNPNWLKETKFDLSVSAAGIVAGLTATHDGGFAVAVTLSPLDARAQLLIKFDADGRKLWATETNGMYSYTGASLIETADHGFAMGLAEANIGSGIIKFDSAGKLLWSHMFEQGQDFISVVECSDSCLILGSAMLTKFSSDGKILWNVHDSATTGYSQFSGMTKTSDGGVAFSGLLVGGLSPERIYSVKYDFAGKKLWSVQIEVPQYASAKALCPSPDGGIIFVGYRNRGYYDLQSLFVLSIGKNSDVNFAKILSITDSGSVGFAIIPTRDNSFAILGAVKKQYPTNLNHFSTLITKIDSNLNGCHFSNISATTTTVSTVRDSLFTIIDEVIADSAANSVNLFAATPLGMTDECAMTDVAESRMLNEKGISLFPNPLTDRTPFSISFDGTLSSGIYDLIIRDLLGNSIKQIKVTLTGAKEDIQFSIPGYTPGVYFLELTDSKGNVRKQKFIKQ